MKRTRVVVCGRLASVVIVGVAAIPLVSCGGLEGDDSEGTVQRETAPLYGGGWLAALWPNGDVNVCWEQGSDTGTLEGDGTSVSVDGPALKLQVQSAVENSWGHAAKLRFLGWGTCPSTESSGNAGTVAIHWETQTNPQALYGYYPSGWTRMRLNPNWGSFSAAAIHEFGHALGFAHEQERPDNWDSNGNPIFCPQTDRGTTALPGGNYYTQAFDTPSIMDYCNGGATTLSIGDIAGVQIAYGRKAAGSIVGPNNRCLEIPLTNGTVTTGTQLQVNNCSSGDNQKFRRDGNWHMSAPAYPSNSYLDVRGGYQGDQGVVQAYTVNSPPSANQQWNFLDAQVQGLGFQCATVPISPGYANGTVVRLGACTGTNQSWRVGPSKSIGTIQSADGQFCWDVPSGSTADNTPIQIYGCHGGFNQRFMFSASGAILFGNKCVDVRPDTNELRLLTCKPLSDTSRGNQVWNLRGLISSQLSSGLCLDIRGGFANDNTPVQTYHCVSGAPNQTWDFYFP